MSHQNLATIMAQYPDLNSFGFGFYYEDLKKPTEERTAIMAAKQQRLREEQEKFEAACAWITAHLTSRKTINPRTTSYGLKHTAEAFLGYLTNGTLIAAMLACGYKHIQNGPHACFNIAQDSLKRVYKQAQDIRRRRMLA